VRPAIGRQESYIIPRLPPSREEAGFADRPLHAGDVAGAAALLLLSYPVLAAYLVDRTGFAIRPPAILIGSFVASGVTLVPLVRGVRWGTNEIAAFVASVGAVLAWTLSRAWPSLLPVGGGVDLTHHLQLIAYIERHWRLVHDPQTEMYLGEMVHYTPGSQLLAALAGAWTGTDGLHAVYAVVAGSVAIKAGLVFLIARRELSTDDEAGIPLALTAVLFLFVPYTQVFGSFTHESFFAQVVSESFAVGGWWALVAWRDRPSPALMILFGVAVSAAFLTWPVWTGPLLLILPLVVLMRRELPFRRRIGFLALGAVLPAAIAAVYVIGRLAWVGYVRAGGALVQDAPGKLGWGLPILSVIGLGLLAFRRRGLVTVALAAAIAVQAFALFKLNEGHGPGSSYMALKMVYLAVYPLAVAAAAAFDAAFQLLTTLRPVRHVVRARAAWVLFIVLAFLVARPIASWPRPKPVVSEPLNLAGNWARSHLDPRCVDYLVADGYTAYWLHLAVLGNPRISTRTGDAATFDFRSAMVRWETASGPPYGVADLTVVPRDVQQDFKILKQFGPAAVVERRKSEAPYCQPPPSAR
jgi:hypothetical protein